ncbi:MAG: V-type ATP synthase subunit I [Lentimicrobiaceae bacterium]|jgi:V/A-type H+-transporting ATPase subunit I|nr:V-type ATP synthase subunit I [Lentimicrobiaceae bacterium]
MIEKMKKYDFLIYHKDYQDFLYKLRELGVVHITQKQAGALSENESLSSWMDMDKRFLTVIKSLEKINEENHVKELAPLTKKDNPSDIIEYVEKLLKEKEELTFDKQGHLKEIERITPLGSFSAESIERFKKRDYHINFYAGTESRFNPQWVEDYNAIVVNKIGTQVYFITFTHGETPPPIEAEHIRPSEKSLDEWKNQVRIVDEKIKHIETELSEIAQNELETIYYYEKRVKDHINFEKIELSGDAKAAEKLLLLEGFVPVTDENRVTEALEKESVYFQVSAPSPEENPPILLKNNKFARSFEMIADLFDKPSYNAFDLTPFFAPFYVIFFGLCLGDAGYGLLILLASFLLKKSKDAFMRSAGNLAMWLGLGTIIFGFVSGTFFGIELLNQTWAWLQPLKAIMLDSNQLFTLALVCGAIQITYAWIIKIFITSLRFGFVYALDTLGWMIAVWGIGMAFYLESTKTISTELMQTICIVCGSLGGFMMLFFNNPQKGLKGVPGSIGSGLYGVYTKVTNLLGDMLSYIRLFALGISGAVMGMVFNDLAVGFAPDIIIVKQLVIILIVLFGHAINIFLNGLGAFIHPMRLTFVEFYNNAGFEGGGKAYTPFKKE